jgi:type I restriction enzyme S subunit
VKLKKLNDVCDFINGLWTGKNPPFINVSVIRNTNFHKSGNLNFENIAELDVEVKQFKTRQLKYGDIILEKSGGGPKQPVGRVCVFEKDNGLYSLSNFTSAIRIKNSKELDYKYLHYFLLNLYVTGKTEKIQTNSTGIRNLQLSLYKEFLVPVLSLATQQKIVAKLDAIFAEIDTATAAAEANANNAEALFQSYLTEVFERGGEDFEQRKLKDISIYMGRGKSKHRPRNDESLYGGIYPFIQTGDVRNAKKYITSFTQTYNEKGLAQSKLWQANTVCITIAANIAEIGILNFDACFPDSVIGIVVNKEKISEEFLYFMLLFEQQMIKSKSKGSAQENINLGTFEDMLFNIPHKIKQENYVEKLNDYRDLVDSILHSQLKKIDSLISLKQSILQKAFNGELVKD